MNAPLVVLLAAALVLLSSAVSGGRMGPTPAGDPAVTVSSGAAHSDVALPTQVIPGRAIVQDSLSGLTLAVVLALAGRLCLASGALPADRQPTRFAPGRRGRALLHGYLN